MSRVFEAATATQWDVDNDIRCMNPACDQPFRLGDAIVELAVDEWQEYRDEPVALTVCIGCAFTTQETP